MINKQRYKGNESLYILGIFCLFVGILMLITSIWSLPYLLLNWNIYVPYFILSTKNHLELYYNLAPNAAGLFVFSGFFFTSMILIIIADILSHRIDSELSTDNTEIVEKNKNEKKFINNETSSKTLVFKIILIIIFIFVTTQIFQWAISSTPANINL